VVDSTAECRCRITDFVALVGAAYEGTRKFLTERDRSAEQEFSPEAVETLVWLWNSVGLDRRRYRIESRLRSVRRSDHFASLPDELRERVREIVTQAER
jgi:hypothetical protein